MEEMRKFPNVFTERRGKKTTYFVKTDLNKSFFEERIVKLKPDLYKEVNPERSKLFASIAKGISQLGLKEDSSVLYLGASHGYTVSFLADVVKNGEIYALDFAPRVVRDLIFICEVRDNIAPMLDDAYHPENYKDVVPKVDVVFMDIAQKEQVKIFLNNCDMFLKEDGFGILALKARSIDVVKKPKDIFKVTRAQLEQVMTVVDYKELEPFEKDHAVFVCKRKSLDSISYDKLKPVQVNFATDKRRIPKKNFSGNRESSFSSSRSSSSPRRHDFSSKRRR